MIKVAAPLLKGVSLFVDGFGIFWGQGFLTLEDTIETLNNSVVNWIFCSFAYGTIFMLQ